MIILIAVVIIVIVAVYLDSLDWVLRGRRRSHSRRLYSCYTGLFN